MRLRIGTLLFVKPLNSFSNTKLRLFGILLQELNVVSDDDDLYFDKCYVFSNNEIKKHNFRFNEYTLSVERMENISNTMMYTYEFVVNYYIEP